MLLPLPNLLAETHMAEVSLQYREDVAASGISGFWYLLIPVVAVLISVVIYKIVTRPPAIVNTPQGMLHELCRVHRVGTRGRILLGRIAEEAELTHPATMLLGVTQFEQAIEKASTHIKYDRRQQATLGMLRRRLFA
jgi:hypothetical protein